MKILAFILNKLITIHAGTAVQKFIATVQLATVPALTIGIFQQLSGWYVENQVFIKLLALALVSDLIVGVWKHAKNGNFSGKKMMLGFAQKMAMICVVYFLSESMLQIFKDAEIESVYFRLVVRLSLFLYPSANTFVNVGIITDGKFPPKFILNGFAKFNETGSINELPILKPNEDEKTNNSDTVNAEPNGVPQQEETNAN